MKINIEGDVFIQFEIQVEAGEYLGKKVSVLYGLPISFRLN